MLPIYTCCLQISGAIKTMYAFQSFHVSCLPKCYLKIKGKKKLKLLKCNTHTKEFGSHYAIEIKSNKSTSDIIRDAEIKWYFCGSLFTFSFTFWLSTEFYCKTNILVDVLLNKYHLRPQIHDSKRIGLI